MSYMKKIELKKVDDNFITDLNVRFGKKQLIIDLVHFNGTDTEIIGTYNTATDTLSFRRASENYLVDEKMNEILKQSIMIAMNFDGEEDDKK